MNSELWTFQAPIPEGPLKYTLSYLLRADDGGLMLIDPGWNSDENKASLRRSLADLGFVLSDITSTISTHFHPDHIGLAPWLRDAVGATMRFSATEQEVMKHEHDRLPAARASYGALLAEWAVPKEYHAELLAALDRPLAVGSLVPDAALSNGDTVAGLRVVATPGHTSGHIALVDEANQRIFTGDHVLPETFAGVGLGSLPGTEPLGDFLESLALLAPFGAFEALPGHEHRFVGLDERRIAIARHQLQRTREVQELERTLGDSPIWDYASRITWTGGFASLRGLFLGSALRQTEMHLGLVRSGRAEALFAQFD